MNALAGIAHTVAKRMLGRPGFYGDYRSFDEALADSTGYNAVPKLKQVNGRTARPKTFESMHVDGRTQQVLAALCRVVTGQPISVLDVGGGDGDYFYRLYGHVQVSSWTVLETPEMVKAMPPSKFVQFVSDPAAIGYYDVVLMSGFVQCVPDPYAAFAHFAARGRYVIVNRLPLIERDRLTVQRRDVVSYPAWFLDANRFLAKAGDVGKILMQWKVPQDTVRLDGRLVEYSGMLIKTH